LDGHDTKCVEPFGGGTAWKMVEDDDDDGGGGGGGGGDEGDDDNNGQKIKTIFKYVRRFRIQ
jgi:hypothetical protein